MYKQRKATPQQAEHALTGRQEQARATTNARRMPVAQALRSWTWKATSVPQARQAFLATRQGAGARAAQKRPRVYTRGSSNPEPCGRGAA